jgi:hypothetical protein
MVFGLRLRFLFALGFYSSLWEIAMSLKRYLNHILPEEFAQCSPERFALCFSMLFVSNFGIAVYFFRSDVFIDWSDWGSVLIMAIAAFFYNFAIVMFLRKVKLPG